MDLTTATPVEIDTELKALYEQSLEIGARLNRQAVSMHYTAGDRKRYVGRREEWTMTFNEVIEVLRSRCADDEEKSWVARDAEKALDTYEALKEERRVNLEAQKALDAEFIRRGGWTRAFLAVGQGMLHVHSSMECSTCHKGIERTRFDWRVEFSGKEEIDVVEAAGDRACTVCYPSAPVETLRRPTSIFSPEEVERARKALERADKKAAADAATVTFTWVESGRSKEKTFKTLRAATNALAGALGSLCWYGMEHPSAVEWLANVEAGRKALGDSWDYDKALAAARKKAVKDAGEYLHQKIVGFNPDTRSYDTEWSDEPLYPKF